MKLSSLVQCDKRTRVCRQGASADSNNMKTAAIVLQVAILVLQYRIISASYGFADLQDHFYDPVFKYGRSGAGKALTNVDDLRLRSHPIGPYFGSYLSGYAPSYSRSLGGSRALLRPQEKPLLLNQGSAVVNPWFQAAAADNGVKPVKEEHPDDLKYDFRTKIHSFR
ncbi:uncharacterized protein [Euwallacea similis]|uniref:uncharacterized protein n=1 Tax=Euwallacea similis TaxID=1736056 RepID=UPI00344E038E